MISWLMAIPCHALCEFATKAHPCTRTHELFHRIFTPLRIYYLPMQKRPELFAASLLVCALFALAPAQADPTPSPSATADTDMSPLEQYKLDRDAFLLALRDRDFKMRIINSTFKNSIDKANSDARAVMASASTPEQKSSAWSTRRNAVALAITIRDAAILALGPMPTPPAKPEKLKHEKNDQKSDQKGKAKR